MPIYCGVDFHARQQLVMWCNTDDGEIHESQLGHQSIAEVREFYAQFSGEVIVGFETSGYSSWFEALLEELARHLLVRTYIMLRDQIDYAEFVRRGVAVRSARVSYRPQVPGKLIERLTSGQPPL